MTTRKHFELAAKTISRIEDPEERRRMAEFNADLFAKSNPNFDRERFLRAAGLEPADAR